MTNGEERSLGWSGGVEEEMKGARGLLQAERATLVAGKGRAAITATTIGLGATMFGWQAGSK